MKITDVEHKKMACPECGGPAFGDLLLAEKKDACYYKVKASAKVWPSAYASGRLVQCRKKGAKNYGNKSESVLEFAPPSDGGDDGFNDDTLKRMAAQWYNGDEDPGVERTLAAAGWEIGQDEGYDDEPGVFVVQAGDVNGRSYMSWPADELRGLMEFAQTGGGDAGDYLRTLASAWYNDVYNTGNLQKGIKSQEDVERILSRGVVCPDGVTRRYYIDYNGDFNGVELISHDFYEHGDLDHTDSRTGKPFSAWDHIEYSDDQLDEGVAEGHADQQRKIFKKNGRPVGEVGIDRESSPGVGQWYMTCYGVVSYGGYDSYEEAVEELKHCLKQKQGVAEAVTLDRSKNPNYPRDPATVKHQLDTAKSLLSDPKTDPDSRREAAATVARLEKSGVAEDQLDEKWSEKYKKSINCANPKGFSQRAHCAGRKKNEETEIMETDELARLRELSGIAHYQELAEEFDLIESIIDSIAERNGVDAETVWEDLESLTEDELYVFAVTAEPIMEDWQKANKKDKTDGMSQKAVNAYRREHPGSKLKTAVTTKPSKLKRGSKASKRRKSYCSRSRGQMKMHSISCSKTPDKAICKARRRWNC